MMIFLYMFYKEMMTERFFVFKQGTEHDKPSLLTFILQEIRYERFGFVIMLVFYLLTIIGRN